MLSLRRYGRAAGLLLWDFRTTLVVVSFVLGMSLVSLLAVDSGMVSLVQLAASRENPTGVVTSIFAHYDALHLLANAEFLVFITGALVFTSYPLTRAQRARRNLWFAWLVFPIAVAVNIVYVVISPGSSYGASGLVYGGFGIAFAFFLINSIDGLGDLARVLREKVVDSEERRRIARSVWWLPWNVVLFGFFFYYLLFDQTLVFGTGDPTINAFVHVLSFALGFVSTYFWRFPRRPFSRGKSEP